MLFALFRHLSAILTTILRSPYFVVTTSPDSRLALRVAENETAAPRLLGCAAESLNRSEENATLELDVGA
jgi:hypothetical protein